MTVGMESVATEVGPVAAVQPVFSEINLEWLRTGNLRFAGVSEADARVAAKNVYDQLVKVLDPDFKEAGLSIVELGLVRWIEIKDGEKTKVAITPTFGLCPHIQDLWTNIFNALETALGKGNVYLVQQNTPAWQIEDILEHVQQMLFMLEESGMVPDFMGTMVKELRRNREQH